MTSATDFIESGIAGGFRPVPKSSYEGDLKVTNDGIDYIDTNGVKQHISLGDLLWRKDLWETVGTTEHWPVVTKANDPKTWLNRWHGMIDTIANGGSIEKYIFSL